MSDVVSLKSGNTYSVEKMLEVIDDLRANVVRGEITSFGAVGVAPNNEDSFYWLASSRPTSRMLMEGALLRLLRYYS
jgi:Iap family predicted aminopeptidase